MLAELTTYVAEVRQRLLYQYLKPKIAGMLEAFGAEAQALEAELWSLLMQTSIGYFGPPVLPGTEKVTARASGGWLDFLGARVGEPRNGDDDGTYATMIATRILANRSSGTIPELLEVIKLAALGVGYDAFTVKELAPAGLEVELLGPVPHDRAARVVRHLRRARAGGVGAMVIHHEDNDELTFQFSSDHGAIQTDIYAGFKSATNGGTFAAAHRA